MTHNVFYQALGQNTSTKSRPARITTTITLSVKDLSCSRPRFETEALNWQSNFSKATKASVCNIIG